MALQKDVKVIGVKEIKLAKLTTNTEGTALAYGTLIDFPGPKSIKATRKTIVKECTGAGRKLGRYEKIDGYDLEFTGAKVPLDALAAVNGGTVTASGATPNQVNMYVETGDVVGGYFKVEYIPEKVDETGIGDFHRVFYCVSGSLNIEEKESDYATCSFKGEAIPAEGKVIINTEEIEHPLTAMFINESAVAIQ